MKTSARRLFSGFIIQALAILFIAYFPDLAFAQQSPFLTGANALQQNITSWLTPVAVILVMVLGGMAMAGRLAWGWVINGSERPGHPCFVAKPGQIN